MKAEFRVGDNLAQLMMAEWLEIVMLTSKAALYAAIMCGLYAAPLFGEDKNTPVAVEAGVASIDFCADQYVLALLDSEKIHAVSREATGPRSMFQNKAANIKTISGQLEELLLSKPGSVLRSWRGSTRTDEILKKAHIKTKQPEYAATLEDSLKNFQKVGEMLGAPEVGQKLYENYSKRLAALKEAPKTGLKAAYITPSGFTAGTETYVSKIIELAGFEPYAADIGISYWAPLPLESVALSQPDIVIASFFGDSDVHVSHWSSGRHGIYTRLMGDLPTIQLPSRYFSCGSTFAVDAAEYIRAKATKLNLFRTRKDNQK